MGARTKFTTSASAAGTDFAALFLCGILERNARCEMIVFASKVAVIVPDGSGYRVHWGFSRSKWFITIEQARAWIAAQGFREEPAPCRD
jgi:hypothetical protein